MPIVKFAQPNVHFPSEIHVVFTVIQFVICDRRFKINLSFDNILDAKRLCNSIEAAADACT
jgi:hypothetical protein